MSFLYHRWFTWYFPHCACSMFYASWNIIHFYRSYRSFFTIPFVVETVCFGNFAEIYMLSGHIFMCQLWEVAGCNCPVENWKISSKRMWCETTVRDRLQISLAISYTDFLGERVSRITAWWIIGVPRIRHLSDGATEKSPGRSMPRKPLHR